MKNLMEPVSNQEEFHIRNKQKEIDHYENCLEELELEEEEIEKKLTTAKAKRHSTDNQKLAQRYFNVLGGKAPDEPESVEIVRTLRSLEEQKRKLLSLGKKLKGQLRTKKLTLKQAEKNLNLLEADIAKAQCNQLYPQCQALEAKLHLINPLGYRNAKQLLYAGKWHIIGRSTQVKDRYEQLQELIKSTEEEIFSNLQKEFAAKMESDAPARKAKVTAITKQLKLMRRTVKRLHKAQNDNSEQIKELMINISEAIQERREILDTDPGNKLMDQAQELASQRVYDKEIRPSEILQTQLNKATRDLERTEIALKDAISGLPEQLQERYHSRDYQPRPPKRAEIKDAQDHVDSAKKQFDDIKKKLESLRPRLKKIKDHMATILANVKSTHVCHMR